MAIIVFPSEPSSEEKERVWPDPPMRSCEFCHQMEANTEQVGQYTVCEYCMGNFLRARDRKFVDGYLDENPGEKNELYRDVLFPMLSKKEQELVLTTMYHMIDEMHRGLNGYDPDYIQTKLDFCRECRYFADYVKERI